MGADVDWSDRVFPRHLQPTLSVAARKVYACECKPPRQFVETEGTGGRAVRDRALRTFRQPGQGICDGALWARERRVFCRLSAADLNALVLTVTAEIAYSSVISIKLPRGVWQFDAEKLLGAAESVREGSTRR
jgi:hypothetical protein